MNDVRLPKQKPPTKDSPTVIIALVVGFFILAAFFGLLAVVIPGAAQMGGAMLVLTVFFGVQYLLWGKWLYPYVVRKENALQQKQSAINPQDTDQSM
jgi:hypothetical protein